MNHATAATVLTSLRQRAENSDAPVVLTPVEVRALQVLYGEAGADSAPYLQEDVSELADKGRSEVSAARSFSWKPEGAPIKDLILCLDFGTSFSKAFASRAHTFDDVPELIDVDFGENEDGTTQYFLPSELLIHDDHVFFGMAARRQFEIVGADHDRLIDSPKQYMTLGTEVAELHQKPLRSKQDPTNSLSQRDALVLYLAHLNRLAEISLQGKGIQGDVRRRYAHPAWDDASAETNSEAMARIMAESIVLAKCYPREFEESMSLATAKDVARSVQMADNEDLPFELLVDPVHEATAAGAGALMATREGERQPYVILDIGAGTTDVAGCLCVNNPNGEFVKVFEVTGARKAIRRAGNNLDNILLSEILNRSSCETGTTEYELVSWALRKQVRVYKESLFDEGVLVAPLKSDETVEIRLDEFLALDPVKNLFRAIEEVVTEAAFIVVGDDGPVQLVATGGGASLPVVDGLVSGPVKKNGRQLRLQPRDAMPEDLREVYPELANIYPQLAVAIGGSHPELPQQKSSVKEGITVPGPLTLGPVYR